MGFQRSEKAGPTGSRWRLTHRSLLAACAVPDEVAGSDRRWVYVLLHGEDPATGWDASRVSSRQAAELLAVLERDLPSTAGYDLVSALRVRSRAFS